MCQSIANFNSYDKTYESTEPQGEDDNIELLTQKNDEKLTNLLLNENKNSEQKLRRLQRTHVQNKEKLTDIGFDEPNVGLMTIDNKKNMTCKSIDNLNLYDKEYESIESQVTTDDSMDLLTQNNDKNADPKIIRLQTTQYSNQKKDKVTEINFDEPTHGNTFGETAGPKVIRNVKLIDAFEKKLNKSKKNNSEAFDDNENDEKLSLSDNMSLCSFVFDNYSNQHTERKNINQKYENNSLKHDILQNNEELQDDKKSQNDELAHCNYLFSRFNEMASNNDPISRTNDTIKPINDVISQNSTNVAQSNEYNNDLALSNDILTDLNDIKMEISTDESVVNIFDDSTDSGIENENLHVYLKLRNFLVTLSESLRLIYKFM